MSTLHRYEDGVCDEKGNLIAAKTKGWWYEPKINNLGLMEMESCSAQQCARYEALTITDRKIQAIFPIRTDKR